MQTLEELLEHLVKTLEVSVLYVEDDDDTREQMRMALDRVVREVHMATNGVEGLQMYLAHKPDIIVTDVMMPVMNGIEFSRLIKENDPASRIIVMTAYDDAETLNSLIDIGVDAFTNKPVIGNKFYLALERCANIVLMDRVLNRKIKTGRSVMPECRNMVEGDVVTQEQIAVLEEEMLRKEREIEQIMYSVCHDLRGPLVTINTFLGYLDKDLAAADPQRISVDLGFIHNAASRMDSLLNGLNNIYQVCRSTSPSETTDFNSLVFDTIETMADRISTAKAIVRVADADVKLNGNCSRLQQIWKNLLDNALKFRREQTAPCIEVGVQNVNGDAVFYVRDNGIGIAEEYKDKIFGMFDKLDRSSDGVGVGLTVVRRIVEVYRGRIWVESDGEGLGCCFYFTLPLAM